MTFRMLGLLDSRFMCSFLAETELCLFRFTKLNLWNFLVFDLLKKSSSEKFLYLTLWSFSEISRSSPSCTDIDKYNNYHNIWSQPFQLLSYYYCPLQCYKGNADDCEADTSFSFTERISIFQYVLIPLYTILHN